MDPVESHTRSESDRVDEQAALLRLLMLGRRRGYTVQAMPGGCEVIRADGHLIRQIALVDVTPMASRLPVASDREWP